MVIRLINVLTVYHVSNSKLTTNTPERQSKSVSLFKINLIFRLIILQKMNMRKVNVEIPESEAGKGRGSGTGSAATPSIAVGGQEVEKTGQKAIGSVDKVERKEKKAVEKVKSKGTDKLEIRRPIARFGPLRGTNLVTINKRYEYKL